MLTGLPLLTAVVATSRHRETRVLLAVRMKEVVGFLKDVGGEFDVTDGIWTGCDSDHVVEGRGG